MIQIRLEKILVALAAPHKVHHSEIIYLYDAGEGKTGGYDESVVIETFSKRSLRQMNLTFSSYKSTFGHESPRKAVVSFEDSLRVVIKCMGDPPKYFSKREVLNNSDEQRVHDLLPQIMPAKRMKLQAIYVLASDRSNVEPVNEMEKYNISMTLEAQPSCIARHVSKTFGPQ
ncbi:hypothetical protein QJS04_geneDACA013555 [Acorus gramineus]|uniref:Uncharacterized protein n=1 Tax=Acorus gramineus TaxID=55184 RepID=A0AAV9AG04_ACOGR|nr:hypothetical protein QJS04_geneDACA013555 [Acorus gramineus]